MSIVNSFKQDLLKTISLFTVKTWCNFYSASIKLKKLQNKTKKKNYKVYVTQK